MTFPSIVSAAVSGAGYGSSDFVATLPASITNGNLLRACGYRTDATTDMTDPTGWTRLGPTGSASGSSRRGVVWGRVATGSDTLTLVRTGGLDIAMIVEQITDPSGGGLASMEASLLVDFSGDGDPPSLTASWGSSDNLWTVLGGRTGADITAYPSGYSNNTSKSFLDGSHGPLAVRSRESAAATENPGTGFSTGGATFLAGTMVVRGSSPAAVLSAPTAVVASATSVTIGVTSNTSGTAKSLRRVGGSPASAATIESTGVSRTVVAATPFTVADTGLTTDVTYTWDWCQAGTSNVVSASATPVAPGPTINTQPTAQTVSEGATAAFSVAATSSGGSLTYQWQRANPGSGSFGNVSGATAASHTTAANTSAGDHGAQYRVNVTDSNGTTTSSAVVLTVNSVGTTSRPGADVSGVGWTASSGAVLFEMVDEASASDADYIISPTLSGSTAPVTLALLYPLAAGAWALGVRARTSSGAGTLTLELLNGAGTVVGTSSAQAITSTFATYTLAVTASAPASRVRITILG